MNCLTVSDKSHVEIYCWSSGGKLATVTRLYLHLVQIDVRQCTFGFKLTGKVSLNLWTSSEFLSAAWGYQTMYDRSQVGH